MQEPVSAPLASLASAGCRASPNSAQSPGYHSAASSPSCSAAASPVSSSSASSSCSSNSSNARSSASSAASSQQQQANLDKLRAQQTSGRVAPNPSAESPIEQQQQHIKEESGPFKPTPQASQSNKTRQPQPQQQHQAANLSGASLASSLFDLLPELGHDGALLTWSHATNSRASLSAALAGDKTFVSGDISLAEMSRYPVPIMARPPLGASDLTLESWLTDVTRARKGIKLTFTSTRTVEPAFRVLARHAESLKGPLILSADILSRPTCAPGAVQAAGGQRASGQVGANNKQQQQAQQPVDAWTFLMLCRTRFPKSIISIGWCPSQEADEQQQQQPQVASSDLGDSMFELDIDQHHSHLLGQQQSQAGQRLLQSAGSYQAQSSAQQSALMQQLAAAAAAAQAHHLLPARALAQLSGHQPGALSMQHFSHQHHNQNHQRNVHHHHHHNHHHKHLSSGGSLSSNSSGHSSGSPSPTSPLGNHLGAQQLHALHARQQSQHNHQLSAYRSACESPEHQLILAAAAAAASQHQLVDASKQAADGAPLDWNAAVAAAAMVAASSLQQHRSAASSPPPPPPPSNFDNQMPLNLNINEADPKHTLGEFGRKVQAARQQLVSCNGNGNSPTGGTQTSLNINRIQMQHQQVAKAGAQLKLAGKLMGAKQQLSGAGQQSWQHVSKKAAVSSRLNTNSPSPISTSPKQQQQQELPLHKQSVANLLCVSPQASKANQQLQEATASHKSSGSGYTREMIDKMAGLVKEYNLTQPITFPVEARLLIRSSSSFNELQRLLYQVGSNSTLTIVAQPEDLIVVEDLLQMRKHFLPQQILFDLPDELAQALRNEMDLM